jgi:hypothetical protein
VTIKKFKDFSFKSFERVEKREKGEKGGNHIISSKRTYNYRSKTTREL